MACGFNFMRVNLISRVTPTYIEMGYDQWNECVYNYVEDTVCVDVTTDYIGEGRWELYRKSCR